MKTDRLYHLIVTSDNLKYFKRLNRKLGLFQVVLVLEYSFRSHNELYIMVTFRVQELEFRHLQDGNVLHHEIVASQDRVLWWCCIPGIVFPRTSFFCFFQNSRIFGILASLKGLKNIGLVHMMVNLGPVHP